MKIVVIQRFFEDIESLNDAVVQVDHKRNAQILMIENLQAPLEKCIPADRDVLAVIGGIYDPTPCLEVTGVEVAQRIKEINPRAIVLMYSRIAKGIDPDCVDGFVPKHGFGHETLVPILTADLEGLSFKDLLVKFPQISREPKVWKQTDMAVQREVKNGSESRAGEV